MPISSMRKKTVNHVQSYEKSKKQTKIKPENNHAYS